MMRREFVERRGWISPERFTDMLGIVNLIPGPNSTELAIHVGAELGGRPGLWVAGATFILPAFSIVLLLAWLYVEYGTLPDVASVLAGVKPVVLAIIAHAVWKLGGGTVRRPATTVLAVVVFVLGILGVHELLLLFGSGLMGIAIGGRGGSWGSLRSGDRSSAKEMSNPPSADTAKVSWRKRLRAHPFWLLGGLFASPTLAAIFFYFLFVGSVLYGSGYVLVAFLRDDLVGALGWLTDRQLLDAVAIGQVTPGPVFTTATFVGYLVGGVPGSVLATLGIFLPSFFFVFVTHGWIARLRSRRGTAGFLDGVNAGAVALIAVALVILARGTLVAPVPWVLASLSLIALIATRVNPTWLIVGGALIGWAVGL